MEYKLFTEYITLQALLKESGIIQSGGAVKGFLADNTVLINGEPENRRGKKIRVGDQVSFNEQTITIIAPTEEDMKSYLEEKAEKERVAKLVKAMNKETKKMSKKTTNQQVGVYRKTTSQPKTKKAVRFPGT